MFEREPRNGYVIVSIELRRDVADLLADRYRDFVSIIEALGHECKRLPPTAEVRAEEDRLREQEYQERQAELKKLGRAGYRLYRQRIKTNGYLKFDGEYRDRPARLSKAQWRRIVMGDIGEELGFSGEYMEFTIPRFRKELLAKIKPRRDQAIIRLYREGFINREIADRVGVSVTTIIRLLKEQKKHNPNLLRELPENHNSLKTKKKRNLSGKPQGTKEIVPGKSSGNGSGEDN